MNDTVMRAEAPSTAHPVPIPGTVLLDWGCLARSSDQVAAYALATFDRSVMLGVDWAGAIVYGVTGSPPDRLWWFAETGEVRE